MLRYNYNLKKNARQLRSNMTEAEKLLWYRLRRRQVLGVQFYRQKPIGNYIVDFYAPKPKLVIEVDGSDHFEKDHAEKDARREGYLRAQNLAVLRFTNLEVLQQTDAVMKTIFHKVLQTMETIVPL